MWYAPKPTPIRDHDSRKNVTAAMLTATSAIRPAVGPGRRRTAAMFALAGGVAADPGRAPEPGGDGGATVAGTPGSVAAGAFRDGKGGAYAPLIRGDGYCPGARRREAPMRVLVA